MDNYNIKIYLIMALSNKIRFWSKEEAVPTHLLLLFKAWWVITCVAYITCTGALWAKRGERGIVHKKECEAWDEGRIKANEAPVTSPWTAWTLHSNWSLMTRCSGLFVWNKITAMHSRSFDDAVREAFRLFPNVPERKKKQKKCLNLLLKRKDVLGLLSSRLGKSLIY